MLRTGCLRRKGTTRLLALLLATMAAAGCYWTRYQALTETHLDLLTAYADKLASYAETGRPATPAEWPEFTYPGERAADFARIAGQRFEGRRSLTSLREAIAIYTELTRSPGILVVPDAAAQVNLQRQRLREAVGRTRLALDGES